MLLRCSQRRLQLLDRVLKGCRVDLKQNVAGLDGHIGLDRDGDNLAGHIRRHLDDPAGDRDLARGRQVVKQPEKRRKNERADQDRDRSRQPSPAHQLQFREYQPQRDNVEAQDDEHGAAPSFVDAKGD